MYIIFQVKNQIKEELQKTLQKLHLPEAIRLETPSSSAFGDLAFPCFSYCKTTKKSPKAIAKEIVKHLQKPQLVDKIEIHGGYINFWLNTKDILNQTINQILQKKEKFGMLKEKNKKVIVEHTSANPNGPLHVGRARNPIIGDTIARLLKAAGYTVETQFYLDNLGKQVAILTWGFHHLNKKDIPPPHINKPDHYAVLYYQKANKLMKKDESIFQDINTLVHKSELGDKTIIDQGKKAYEPVLKGITESLSAINITIDTFIPESKFVKNKSVFDVLKRLKQIKYFKNEKGAYYLDLKTFGIKGRSTKFFLTRSNGTTLYATRDIAYHLWKNDHADILINILGEDHKLESKQVEISLELLNAEKKPIPVFYSFVTLPEGKMSTRQGRVIYLDDLIQESKKQAFKEVKKRRGTELSEEKMKEIADIVGIGALRYNIIKVQPEKDIEFKWKEALSFEGNTAPFILYSIARCASIIRKSKMDQNKLLNLFDETKLTDDTELQLGKQLASLPDVIQQASQGYKPHLISQFLFETASLFNQFYRDCPVLTAENNEMKNARLALVSATKIILENGLHLLGIDTLEEM